MSSLVLKCNVDLILFCRQENVFVFITFGVDNWVENVIGHRKELKDWRFER